tara:strand:+ start:442 stop:669 length:228 start_codon:yes stop_codon:yes gene_type:complete
MDMKSLLVNLAEKQADKMKDEAVNWLGSEEFTEQLATKINEKIDIPFVDEDKEQIFFEKLVDLVTDVLENFFKGK